MSIIKHIPALQVLIPFFAALFSSLSFNKNFAWMIATICIAANFILSIYGVGFLVEANISYDFGNWMAPIGIEYRLDMLNQPIILFANGVLLFFLVFSKNLINKTILPYIENKYSHFFYGILLFAHAGYLGVLSTNDLFNLYVFIEISSLATYVLISKGDNPRSLIGAFDYLTLGTIAATLILIGIGFLFAITGSLNVTDISNILSQYTVYSKLIITAIGFFLCGIMLKLAFFPMHFWMIRAYSSTSPLILTYISAISGIIGIYIMMRFIHFVIDPEIVKDSISYIFRILSVITILICTFLGFRSGNFKKIILYSSASQVGYAFLIISLWLDYALLFQLLILDSINKIALFLIVSHLQNRTNSFELEKFKFIENSSYFKIFSALALLFNASLPLTSMFFLKIRIFELMANNQLWFEFAVVLVGAIFAVLYNLKLARALFFSPISNGQIHINTNIISLVVIVIIEILTLIYMSELFKFTHYIESVIIRA